MRLLAVDAPQVYVQQPLYETHLRSYCARYPERSFRRWQEEAHAGTVQFWLFWDVDKARADALVGSELQKGDDGKIVNTVHFCGGRGARDWTHLIDEIHLAGIKAGACKTRMMAREGWKALFPDTGWRQTHILLEKVR